MNSLNVSKLRACASQLVEDTARGLQPCLRGTCSSGTPPLGRAAKLGAPNVPMERSNHFLNQNYQRDTPLGYVKLLNLIALRWSPNKHLKLCQIKQQPFYWLLLVCVCVRYNILSEISSAFGLTVGGLVRGNAPCARS